MHRPVLTAQQSRALGGALVAVAETGGRTPTDAQRTVVERLSTLLLGIDEPAALDPVATADLAAALTRDDEREFAAELLVLAALVDVRPAQACADEADRACRALGRHPENLDLLHEVVQRRIRHSRHHLFRRFLVDSLRTGSISGDLVALRDLVEESHAHPEIAAPYLALEHLPEDTFGNHFFWFYRNRGFRFPGEKGALPLAYGFEVHDTAHVLSGYNTDPRDEINVLAFQSGASTRLPWLILGVNLVTFNTGLAYGPTHLLHYQPHEGNLDPAEFVRALDRGLAVRRDLSGDFDIHAHWQVPLAELRAELGVESDADVRIPA